MATCDENTALKINVILLLLIASSVLTCNSPCIIPDSSSSKPPSCESHSTLNHFCENANGGQNDTLLNILSGTHILNTTCELRDVNNVTLRGQKGSNVIIKCSSDENIGFKFLM